MKAGLVYRIEQEGSLWSLEVSLVAVQATSPIGFRQVSIW